MSLVQKFEEIYDKGSEGNLRLEEADSIEVQEFKGGVASLEALNKDLSNELDKAKDIIKMLPTEVLEAKLGEQERMLLIRRDLMKPFFPNLNDQEMADEIQNALWFQKLDMTRRSKKKLMKNYMKKLMGLKNDNTGTETVPEQSQDEPVESLLQGSQKQEDGEGS